MPKHLQQYQSRTSQPQCRVRCIRTVNPLQNLTVWFKGLNSKDQNNRTENATIYKAKSTVAQHNTAKEVSNRGFLPVERFLTTYFEISSDGPNDVITLTASEGPVRVRWEWLILSLVETMLIMVLITPSIAFTKHKPLLKTSSVAAHLAYRLEARLFERLVWRTL